MVAAMAITAMTVEATAQRVINLQNQTGVYGGTTDTTLYEDVPDSSLGGGRFLYVGNSLDSQERRVLIRFALPVIPENEEITQAELFIRLYGIEGFRMPAPGTATPVGTPVPLSIRAHRLISGWVEGTSERVLDDTAMPIEANPGDATWRSSRHNTALWSTAGGDYSPEVSGFGAAYSYAGDSGIPYQYVRFTGLQLVDDVRLWREQPSLNHGWVILADSRLIEGNVYRFSSSEFLESEGPIESGKPILRLTLMPRSSTPTPTPTITPTPGPTGTTPNPTVSMTTMPPATATPTMVPMRADVIPLLLGISVGDLRSDWNFDNRVDAGDLALSRR